MEGLDPQANGKPVVNHALLKMQKLRNNMKEGDTGQGS